MSDRPGFLSVTGGVVVAIALVCLVAWTLIGGFAMFSPGGLNAVAKGQALGGVTSHAQLAGRCAACHAAPWSSRTMADRCNACHADVAAQIQGNSGIHGGLVGAMSAPSCRACHSEHRGANGALTANFNHNSLPFKLTGAHVNVACNLCHVNAASLQDLRNTPQDCYSCHKTNDKHGGTFGQLCGQCHSTTTWANATFNHTVFPVNHGSNQQVATCATCHPTNFSTYTCLGCHFHTAASVQSDHEGQSLSALMDCIRCHPGGRAAGN